MNICWTLSIPRPIKPYHFNTIIISCPSPFKYHRASANIIDVVLLAQNVHERKKLYYFDL
jgi:hypothetical protein